MLDIIDTLAVREVVERQSTRRRRICELLMHECNQREIGERLGMTQQMVSYDMACIRRDFIAAGFRYQRGGSRMHGWRRKQIHQRKRMQRRRMRQRQKKVGNSLL
jgi:hypothetical protein